MNTAHTPLRLADPEIESLVSAEAHRQEQHLELIASENHTSLAVMQAQGSVLTNKYAEGYPGRRYYGGCEHVDGVETLAIERARALFGAEAANVQPHSGSQANQAVYLAFLKPGERILGLALPEGGHLTHGAAVNQSGKLFEAHFYSLGADERIDYDALHAQARALRPRLLIAGASAYGRHIDFERMAHIARDAGSLFMVDMAHYAGLIAAGEYPSPVPHADIVTSTTHKTLRGPRGGLILSRQVHAAAINKAVFPGMQGGPLMHVIAAKAVAFREAASDEFKVYQRQVLANARVMARVFMEEGIRVVSGGTDSHLFLLDTGSVGLSGLQAEQLLSRANVTVNRNSIPGETRAATVTSGIRIGTPAITTRGLHERDCETLAHHMAASLLRPDSEEMLVALKTAVKALTLAYPVYAPSRG